MTFDENVLSYIGGIRNNDLNNILETNEFDSNDELQTTRRSSYHEFQRDGITICTTFTPFKPENARLLVRKNYIIIDIRVMYDHSKGTTLILSKNISLLVTIKGV